LKCPKCGSSRIVDARVHSWHKPAVKCQCCGLHIELPETQREERVLTESFRVRYVKCSTPGCEVKINAHGGYDKCRACRVDGKLQDELQERLARRVAKRETRERRAACSI
jgi:transcription elongation factor Elf1